MFAKKENLISELVQQFDAVSAYIHQLTPEKLVFASNHKWSALQQLDHLIKAIKPVNLALGLPKFIPRLFFGKCNRPVYDYETLVKKYQDKLDNGAKASKAFVPPLLGMDKKNNLLDMYEAEKQKLIKRLKQWTEADLDYYVLPHPIIGKITVREILFFTIYHTQLHLQSVQKQLAL